MAGQPGSSKAADISPPSPVQKVALPLHVQKLQSALDLDGLINQVEKVFNESLKEQKTLVKRSARYDLELILG